jgi:transcriptional regulator GlxA family with amidase domain
MNPMVRSVVLLGFPGIQALDLVGPFEVFTAANLKLTEQGRPAGYGVAVVSAGGAPFATGTGLGFAAAPLPDPKTPIDTLVLPGGRGVDAVRADADLMSWIRAMSANARRVASVCTGAFLAAEAGLLDGCRATTHWAYTDRLATEFPTIDVDPAPVYLRSSDTVWTAGGVASGIDVTMALVEDDHGTELAQSVSRWLVVDPRKPGEH